MDKGNIKIILISLAVLLAILLAYKFLSKKADNQLEVQAKIDNANADIQIAQEKKKIRQGAVNEENSMLSQIQQADGYDAMADYRASLSDDERKEYDRLYEKYVTVLGVDPGLISLDALRNKMKQYDEWLVEYKKLEELVGDQALSMVSFFDEDTDEAHEVQRVYNTAVAEIQRIKEQMWTDAQTTFQKDYAPGNLKAGPQCLTTEIRRWLLPEDVQTLQANTTLLYDNHVRDLSKGRLNGIYDNMHAYFYKNGTYASWRKNGNDITEFWDMSSALRDAVLGLSKNDCAYISNEVRRRGIGMFTNAHNNGNVFSLKDLFSFTEMVKNIDKLQNKIFNKNIKSQEKKMSKLAKATEAAKFLDTNGASETYTVYGYTERQLVQEWLPNWAKNQYSLTQSQVNDIKAGKTTVEKIFEEE